MTDNLRMPSMGSLEMAKQRIADALAKSAQASAAPAFSTPQFRPRRGPQGADEAGFAMAYPTPSPVDEAGMAALPQSVPMPPSRPDFAPVQSPKPPLAAAPPMSLAPPAPGPESFAGPRGPQWTNDQFQNWWNRANGPA